MRPGPVRTVVAAATAFAAVSFASSCSGDRNASNAEPAVPKATSALAPTSTAPAKSQEVKITCNYGLEITGTELGMSIFGPTGVRAEHHYTRDLDTYPDGTNNLIKEQDDISVEVHPTLENGAALPNVSFALRIWHLLRGGERSKSNPAIGFLSLDVAPEEDDLDSPSAISAQVQGYNSRSVEASFIYPDANGETIRKGGVRKVETVLPTVNGASPLKCIWTLV
jgi:hypothetical protein